MYWTSFFDNSKLFCDHLCDFWAGNLGVPAKNMTRIWKFTYIWCPICSNIVIIRFPTPKKHWVRGIGRVFLTIQSCFVIIYVILVPEIWGSRSAMMEVPKTSEKKISKLFGPIFNDSQRIRRIFWKSGNMNHPSQNIWVLQNSRQNCAARMLSKGDRFI